MSSDGDLASHATLLASWTAALKRDIVGGRGDRMVTFRVWFGALVILATATTALAQQSQDAAGRIKIASGAAFIVRAGSRTLPGARWCSSGRPETSADGRLGITLKDDTLFHRPRQRNAG